MTEICPEHGVKVVQSFKEAQWGMGPHCHVRCGPGRRLARLAFYLRFAIDRWTGPKATSCPNRGFPRQVIAAKDFNGRCVEITLPQKTRGQLGVSEEENFVHEDTLEKKTSHNAGQSNSGQQRSRSASIEPYLSW